MDYAAFVFCALVLVNLWLVLERLNAISGAVEALAQQLERQHERNEKLLSGILQEMPFAGDGRMQLMADLPGLAPGVRDKHGRPK